jgi:LPXTG-motif cell wall-anchored protein
MKTNYGIMLIFISVLLMAAPAASQDIPQLPMILYGNIQVNDDSAPTGTIIAAYTGDTLLGITQIEAAGEYGDIPSNRLVINEPPGTDDIQIFIQTPSMSTAVEVQQITKWGSGEIKQLDLSAVYKESTNGGSVNLRTVRSNRITSASTEVEDESMPGGGGIEGQAQEDIELMDSGSDELPNTSSKSSTTILLLAVIIIAIILGAIYYFKTKSN